MWPFKKKKIYRVEYIDAYGDHCCCVVKAYDEAHAWRAAENRYAYSFMAERCISIAELKENKQ